MKYQTILLSLILMPMLAACGGTSAWKGVCKANVEEQLLNPETLQMMDFQVISDERYAAIFAQNFLDANPELSANSSEKELLKIYAATVLEAVSKDRLSKSDMKLFSARIRAEAAGGNTITKVASCLAVEDNCACEF
jgi:hypothetical protein